MPRLDSYPTAAAITGVESVAVFQAGHVRTATTQQLKDFGGGGGGTGGSGTVNAGAAGTLAYYAGIGTTVSPLTLGTNLSISGGALNAVSSIGTPAGTPGQLQYNNSGALAGAIIGSGLSLSSGTLSAPYSYTLPVSSPSVLGGVKVGTGLSIDGAGAISAVGGSPAVPVTTVATSGASQALSFPASGQAAYDVTLTGNCILTLSGGTAGQQQTLTLWLRGGTGGFTPSWPSGVKWRGGSAPSGPVAAGAISLVTFRTPDGGTTMTGEY